MQVKSIAECSMGSILQYFRPSLINYLPLRPLFCLFLSGRLRQVLLYISSHETELCTFNVQILLLVFSLKGLESVFFFFHLFPLVII